MGKELLFSIFLQLIGISFFAGIYVATIKTQGKLIEKMEKNNKESINEIKENFQNTILLLKENFEHSIEDIKQNFHEKFEILDKKQDKHNNLIERMVVVEQSTKSMHHRLDDWENRNAHIR